MKANNFNFSKNNNFFIKKKEKRLYIIFTKNKFNYCLYENYINQFKINIIQKIKYLQFFL